MDQPTVYRVYLSVCRQCKCIFVYYYILRILLDFTSVFQRGYLHIIQLVTCPICYAGKVFANLFISKHIMEPVRHVDLSCVCFSLTSESCSHQPRSTRCWFTMPMPSSTTKSIEMLPVNTVWHCNRKRCSAKHPKSVPPLVELQLTYRHRYGR